MVGDAYIRGGTNANTNYGSDTFMGIRNDVDEEARKLLIKFDLPPRVISATLTFTIVAIGNDASRTVRIRPISNVWDESTVTWNSLGTITTSNAQDVQFDVAYTASVPF